MNNCVWATAVDRTNEMRHWERKIFGDADNNIRMCNQEIMKRALNRLIDFLFDHPLIPSYEIFFSPEFCSELFAF